MKFNIEQWLESHRKQCARDAKNMGFWFSSANQDLFGAGEQSGISLGE
jgi:hypothetical protein